MFSNPTKEYVNTRASTSVHGATPHKLVELLYGALKENLSIAKGAIARGDVSAKAHAIKKSLDILVRLQAVLDFESGGDIALRLDELYTFCTNRLALANATNDATIIDEVFRVIAELAAGWSELGNLEEK